MKRTSKFKDGDLVIVKECDKGCWWKSRCELYGNRIAEVHKDPSGKFVRVPFAKFGDSDYMQCPYYLRTFKLVKLTKKQKEKYIKEWTKRKVLEAL